MSSEDSAPTPPATAEAPSFRKIRRAGPDDAALLARVAAETFPLACPPHTLPESIAAFIAENLSEESFEGYLADPDRALFIAEAEPESEPLAEPESGPLAQPESGPLAQSLTSVEAAGYTMVVFGEPADPDVAAAVTVRPTAELSKVYVREGFHGAGLAARLVAVSVEAARSRGASSVWLGVNQLNARANRFYEKQGFALVGTKRFLVGERYEDDFVRLLSL